MLFLNIRKPFAFYALAGRRIHRLPIFPSHHVVQPHKNNTIHADVVSKKLLSNRGSKYKAVIFDKDGTLVCFDTMWVPWARKVAETIVKRTGLDVSESVLDVLGVCSSGVLAEGTTQQIKEALVNVMLSKNVQLDHAETAIQGILNKNVLTSEQIKPLHDVKALFTLLKEHAIKIAVCTSDDRQGTVKALSELDVIHLVDTIVAGNDPDGRPKPDSHNGRLICERLDVEPSDVVMVGDTATDVAFAKNSNFGGGVAVLSGVGLRNELEQTWYGDTGLRQRSSKAEPFFEVIPSVADLIPILLPDQTIQVSALFKDLERAQNMQCKLVVMDKDGTLASIYPRWANWAQQIAAKLETEVSLEVADEFLQLLGYSRENRRAIGGLLPECSLLRIKESLEYLLLLKGYGLEASKRISEKVWLCPSSIEAVPIPEVVSTVRNLKKTGIKVAVNTSDFGVACSQFLSASGLLPLVDMVMTAEDADRHPKPLPHTLLHIMETMKVSPEETIVVGDCQSDMLSGRAANVGLNVGVLSGFSAAHHLLPHADVLMPNLSYLPYLIDKIGTNVPRVQGN